MFDAFHPVPLLQLFDSDAKLIGFVGLLWGLAILATQLLVGWFLYLDAEKRQRQGKPVRFFPSLGWGAIALFLSWWMALAFYYLMHNSPWRPVDGQDEV